MLYETVLALAYMQEKDFFHGELSPDIILETSDGHFLIGDKLKYRATFP